ncbi:MAG: polysaccharide biosynthesis protein [Bacteroidales bacterium]|nr:polysaccharide biosynthesis protein [Bacteroidales bacterium]
MAQGLTHKIFYAIAKRYRHSPVSRWIVLVADMMSLVLSFAIAAVFALHDQGWQIEWVPLMTQLFGCLTMTTILFFVTGTYRGIIRHSGLYDVYRILLSCGISFLIGTAAVFINNNTELVNPRLMPSYTMLAITYMALGLMMMIFRIVCQRIYNEYVKKQLPWRNVVIYGAGSAGVIAHNALKTDSQFEYRVIAFIDDNTAKVNQAIDGVPIMQAKDVLNAKFIEHKRVKQLVIAIPSLDLKQKQNIMNKALDLGLTVKSVPHIKSWINGTFSSNQIEDIKIEDLLERESIKLDNMNVVREVLDKTILVTGAAGSIGSEICRQVIQYHPKRIVMVDQAESPMYDLQWELRNTEPYKQHTEQMAFEIANIKDAVRMREIMGRYRPDVIYHAAAYKHVPFMEENVYEALAVNVFGTKLVADLAIEYGVQKFVMVSTDKAVNPTNVMGASKRMAEIYIQSRSTESTHFVTTRFGNVLGSNGSVIPLFKKQLAAGGPLTVTHKEITRYFMTIPEACSLVLEAGAMGEGGDIFVFDMGQPVKIYDLAVKMIQLSGLQGIEIKEIGLRPGEKLYEELLATKENTMPTYHSKIMRAQVRTYPLNDIDREYGELRELMPKMDEMELVAKMKEIVPEYVSNNSVFCTLDKKN